MSWRSGFGCRWLNNSRENWFPYGRLFWKSCNGSRPWNLDVLYWNRNIVLFLCSICAFLQVKFEPNSFKREVLVTNFLICFPCTNSTLWTMQFVMSIFHDNASLLMTFCATRTPEPAIRKSYRSLILWFKFIHVC